MNQGGIGKAVLLVLLGALIVAPASAPAAKGKKKAGLGKLSERSSSVIISSAIGSAGSTTATCPGKAKAISGGFTSAPASPSSSLVIYESLRAGTKGWRVSGLIVNGPSTQTLTAYVYCHKGPAPKSRATAGSVPLGVGGFLTGSVSATCPKGTSAVSGGFTEPAPSFATASFVYESARTAARTWRTSTAGVGTAEKQSETVTTIAYCLEGKAGKSRAASISLPPNGGLSVIAPSCPRTLAAGGFNAPLNASPVSIGIVTESRRLNATQWQVTAQSNGGAAVTLSAFGYCA